MSPKTLKIITVGISPSWDIVSRVDGIDWGGHENICSQNRIPAGKALNVSRALAWLGQKSIAAGLWGQDDYEQMLRASEVLKKHAELRFTIVPGQTRQNITVIDTLHKRQMHLRDSSTLADSRSLDRLKIDLEKIVDEDTICVFAGALPDGDLAELCTSIIKTCRDRGADIVIDSSGPALKTVMDADGIWLAKPNMSELSELVGTEVEDTPRQIVRCCRAKVPGAELVLVSRGEKGAVLVGSDFAFTARTADIGREVSNTVGCGDYLLAGFIHGFYKTENLQSALKTAVKTAAAKAFGWTENNQWSAVADLVDVNI